MDAKKVIKWGLIVVGVFLVYRLVSGWTSEAASSLQQTWQPGLYPPTYGGGILYAGPSTVITTGGYYPYQPGWRSRRQR